MSVGDWLSESKTRVRTEDTPTALKDSLRDLATGARYQLEWALRDALGLRTVESTLAGESVLHLVDSPTELRRALTAMGERRPLEWLFAEVDDETIVWDVGSYRGTYAITAALKGAAVLAFEPHAPHLHTLEQHAALNGVTIDTYDLALSDTARSQVLRTDGSESRLALGGDEAVETVPGDTVSPPPDVLKIDVEGHEAAVLRGLAGHLENVDRVLVEVHDGVSSEAVAAQLHDAELSVVGLETPRSETYLGGTRHE